MTGNVLPPLCVHIPNDLPKHINITDVLDGKYSMELIGGNHTRQSLTEIQHSVNVPVVIYAGLTNDQALYLSYEHNRIHHNNRVMTFAEDVLLFRRKIVGNPDEGLNQAQRTKWWVTMADALGINVSI